MNAGLEATRPAAPPRLRRAWRTLLGRALPRESRALRWLILLVLVFATGLWVFAGYVPLTTHVLPMLFGDRLVGRIELRLERRERALAVVGMWFEDGFDPVADPRFAPAFADALRAHAAFGDAERVILPRNQRHRPVVGAVSKLFGRGGRVSG